MFSAEAKAQVLAGLIQIRDRRDVARRRVFDYYTDPYDGSLQPQNVMEWDSFDWDADDYVWGP